MTTYDDPAHSSTITRALVGAIAGALEVLFWSLAAYQAARLMFF